MAFFQEELPTTFFIRRLTRCRITRLASQCAKLVGESMPDGVDYQLQPELTEHILQVISHEFYQRPPQEFYQSRRPEDGCFEWFFPVVTVGQDLRRAFFLHCTSIFQQFLDMFSLKSILLIYI